MSASDRRYGDRRSEGRRKQDKAIEMTAISVVHAARLWRDAMDSDDATERIHCARKLKEAVAAHDAALEREPDEEGSATADAIMGLTVVVVALAPRSLLPTGTWMPLLAVVVALATVVIIAGMRREP